MEMVMISNSISQGLGMEDTESSQQGRKRVRGSSRRVWQKREEDVLMAAMMQLIGQQWRNENGQFKPGFYSKLEEKLNFAFPGTDLRASPHIESKVKLWKKHYYAVTGMLNTSGFGWNDTDKIVNVDSDQVWENYLKKDINAKGLRGKPFPYFDDWCVLFGKDRATGDLAEGPAETVAAMNEEDVHTNDHPEVAPLPNEETVSVNGTTAAGPSNGRRRSRNESISIGLTSMAEQFGNFFNQTDARMGEIAKRIGYSQDLSDARKMVYAKLVNVPLESKYRLKAASMIVREATLVDLFFSLPKEDVPEWVYMLLAGEI